tara:strand:+ start:207 stop:452 length:246 start_codon:yes stop_codon:yes gene_type:complete
MKRLLLPLLAALALPTAVSAESVWLVLINDRGGRSILKIEMESMEQCIKEGSRFKDGLGFNNLEKKLPARDTRVFTCIRGK